MERVTIIQGSNSPLVVTLDVPADTFDEIAIGIYTTQGKALKQWELADVTIYGEVITCPLTQEETAALPVGAVAITTKGRSADGTVEFYGDVMATVMRRYDKGVSL